MLQSIYPHYIKYRTAVQSLTHSFIHDEHNRHTHLNKLVGLLPVQPVGDTEGIRSIWLVELLHQLGKASVDIILDILGFQALWTK